jgi:excisionase family DNA binding protein
MPGLRGGCMIEQHYRTADVAALLSFHEDTALRLARRGELRSVRVGSERRFPESAIRDYLERQAERPNVVRLER